MIGEVIQKVTQNIIICLFIYFIVYLVLVFCFNLIIIIFNRLCFYLMG